MNALYVITTPIYKKVNRYKFGRTSGSAKKILTTYVRYLGNPELIFYATIKKDNRIVESEVLNYFKSSRIRTARGRLSEWIEVDIKILLEVIKCRVQRLPIVVRPNFEYLMIVKFLKHLYNNVKRNGGRYIYPCVDKYILYNGDGWSIVRWAKIKKYIRLVLVSFIDSAIPKLRGDAKKIAKNMRTLLRKTVSIRSQLDEALLM